MPGWELPSGTVLVDDGQGGTGLVIDGALTSSAFTLPADIQQLTFRYKASDVSQTGIYPTLLRGPSFATATALSGGPLTGSAGTWKTYKVNVTAYAGETVKLKFSPQLQPVYVDAAGVLEQAVPGWTLTGSFQAVTPGDDAHGTYVTAATGGTIELSSSTVDTGTVLTSAAGDGRSYLVTYALGTGTAATVRVWWIDAAAGTWQVYTDASNTADGVTVKNGRFTLYEATGVHGYFRVQITNGGKLYSIGDNVARQQLAEPFSQQAGIGVDTSTGSYGTSETDLSIEGGPLPLSFTRYYRGHADRHGELGYRWTHTYDTFLGIYGSDVAVVLGSGREEFFDENGGSYTPVDVRVKSTLTKLVPPVAGVDYRYTTKDKLVYNFEGACSDDYLPTTFLCSIIRSKRHTGEACGPGQHLPLARLVTGHQHPECPARLHRP